MEQAKLDAIPREYSLSFRLSLISLREEREEDVKEIESRPQELCLSCPFWTELVEAAEKKRGRRKKYEVHRATQSRDYQEAQRSDRSRPLRRFHLLQ